MPIIYEDFMKHAAKLIKTGEGALVKRPELNGVKHLEDGSLVVTDSHRLYIAKNVHSRFDGVIINPATHERLDEIYPDVSRIIPSSDLKNIYSLELEDIFKASDIINILDDKGVMKFQDNLISYYSHEIKFAYDSVVKFDAPFAIRAKYVLDAMNLLKVAGAKEVQLRFFGAMRPIYFEYENLIVLLMPVRTY